ncbi:hypothetical protein L202_07114 [Cryptococcus amylolentus CBS 6039]|uniref:5'-Nucleotidase C-terminal domain-containing protein n=1 Tax=Cryptococcus amylolentus CBS 6039 TaxID=1295533 RepID=A0A1E3HEM6_9TREE|nr:hypothetical protein L202_07114 [Cryptococcus amylolentus CBS 6039]ODN74799.1 hypothetical protein L202_07114 [Cryptococcus amylolentus CBS 6039]
MPTLPILCFNDVYRVQQKYNPQPGAPEDNSPDQNITVSQFAQLLLTERSKWADKSTLAADGEMEKEGLVLFAGDVFSPSVESSVTRGSHMVPILNAIKVDAACVGNHDFDSGYPHLTKLIQSTTFPWMLSNIVDINTGVQPETLQKYHIFERCGVKIGVIGLVEQDWIATIPSWPHNFKYRSMTETALELSRELRDPNGEHQVDLVIALTHCRVPNDIKLANELGAVAGKAGLENEHGVDLIIGGHDHVSQTIGQGASSWEGYSGRKGAPGTLEDTSCLIMKNGTDFRDLTSASLELTPSPPGSIRKHLITSLTGRHHYVLPTSPSSPAFEQLVKSLLSSVSEALQKPVCFTLAPFDARSDVVRVEESGLGNWIADVLMHAFAESKIAKKEGGGGGEENEDDEGPGADAAIICGGTLRGDSQYGPGKITIGDILEILPFDDPVVCLEIDGAGIWSTIESALSKWPAQEGRFPIISGLAVKWDHKRPPNNRVISIHKLVQPIRETDDDWEDPEDMVDFREQEDGTRVVVKNRRLKLGEEVKNEEGGRMYKVITRDYMAQGFDGFEPLKNRKFIVDDENGQIMSSILRSFLLGSAYIFRHKQLEEAAHSHLSRRTSQVLLRARAQHQTQTSPSVSVSSSPKREILAPVPSSPNGDGGYLTAGSLKAHATSPGSDVSSSSGWGLLKRHVVDHDWGTIRNALHVARHEHMSGIDSVPGQAMRQTGQHLPGAWSPVEDPIEEQTSDPTEGVPLDDGEDITIQDLAIVCPLIDGRMRDVSAGKD